MKKKYYDGFIVHDILDAHLKPGKMLEVLKAFAEVKGVDAVEVIRCKDCARNPNNGKARTICPCPMDRYMGPEGYCSKAVSKEADE